MAERDDKGHFLEGTEPGPGRTSDYDPAMNDTARKLALLGLTDEELATFFGVHVSTYYRWQADNSGFREAVNEGKVIADANVADSFYKRATGEHVEIEKIRVNKVTGEAEVIKVKTYIPGEAPAALNWLKNRQPTKWRDKQEIDLTANVKVEKIVQEIVDPQN